VQELFSPDAMIIEKLNPGKAIYLIARGECAVDYRHGNFHTQTSSQYLREA